MPDPVVNYELERISVPRGSNDECGASANSHSDQRDGATRRSVRLNSEFFSTTADHRVIFINHNHPQLTKYLTNKISTAKYNLLSFLPLFLYEQFRRLSNVFFLAIAVLQQIPDVSPTGRFTTLVPLLFILAVSAAKEILEDYKRHRADDETNHRKVEVLRDGSWVTVMWKNVVVGDVVKVLNNTFFPTDLVLISSSEPQGMCFIETSNLDGETNLKIRQSLPQTAHMTTTDELKKFVGAIGCELPNRHLYEFVGTIQEVGNVSLPMGPDQVLLRGAMLRNTSWVFGVVIYTGHETKLLMNSTKAPLKRSTVDKTTNLQVLLMLGILFAICVISTVFNEIWNARHANTDWYIGLKGLFSQNFFYSFMTFVILFNNLIPISLQVTLEMVRFIQAIFINMDVEMYYAETDTPAMARTSNLNEELGQVKYIFSDKTGTLTRNIMEFKKCAVGDVIYCAANDLVVEHIHGQHENAELLQELLVVLSVCHTVIPEKKGDGVILYHAASPDERALVEGAHKYGYVFETRTPQNVTVNIFGQLKTYEILNVIEFTSDRKRMSVIVRNPEGKLKLYCKGADNVIFERLSSEQTDYGNKLIRHLEEFATEGLRTLCCAVTELNETKYQNWCQLYHDASVQLEDRDEQIAKVAEMLERDLTLIGATAIEDKLQEGVPETIEAILKAEIYLWVLTGDKQETAVNIGYSSRLITQSMSLLFVNAASLDGAREIILRYTQELGPNLEKQNDIALIIDGKTLQFALSCELRTDFIKLCLSCHVVVCCRVSPIQKAEVVEHVTKYTNAVTLAIGDGANDVAMIQKAHVGVGISGQEGLQAACASDYSIAQFRFLARLLLVHGSYNYVRMCKLILYSFYKNICLYMIELWFAMYSGWSGQVLFERWCIAMYNVFFTAFPPFAIGIFDKACNAEILMSNPQLYSPAHRGELFNVKIFWMWVVNGVFHSILLYWLTMYMCQNDALWVNGKEGGWLVMGNFVYTYVVVTVCYKAGLVTNYFTWPTNLALWGSPILWFLAICIYSNIYPVVPVGSVMTGMHIMVFTSAVFWFGLIFVPLVTIVPDFFIKVVRKTAFKTLEEALREHDLKKHILSDSASQESGRSLSETARLLKNVRSVFTRKAHTRIDLDMELSHGFAFSQEEGGTVSQADVIRAYDTNIPKPVGD